MSRNSNLIVPTSEQARINGAKGGRASAKAKKEKKLLKECLEILLEKKYDNDEGKKVTGSEAISIALIQKAINGDTKAFELIRDTIGQKPIDKVEAKNTNLNQTVELTDEQIDKILNEQE